MWSKDDAVAAWRRGQAAVAQLPEAQRPQASQALARERNQLVQACQAELLRRRLDEAGGLEESLLWFWFNHFNVFWGKGLAGAALPSYVEDALRPHVHGRFEALLLAALTHPAMLVYLDNADNAAGRVNENLARELLELHTLGVDGGYTQADVQAVARVLTGLGLAPLQPPQWTPRWQPLVVQRGEVLFDPRRHDFGPKQVLGQALGGEGFGEVQALVRLLAAHPATARHVARRLGLYLLGDGAPAVAVERAAAAFLRTGGELPAVVQALLAPGAGRPPRTPTFKDPLRWVLSAVQLLRAGLPLRQMLPVQRWLQALGQPLFGRVTPDGYSLRGADWLSAGQLAQRFELAREMVAAMPRLVDGAWTPALAWAAAPARQALQALDAPAAAVLERAEEPGARLALLLSGPSFMHW